MLHIELYMHARLVTRSRSAASCEREISAVQNVLHFRLFHGKWSRIRNRAARLDCISQVVQLVLQKPRTD